jgi:hypothetical protein
MDSQKLAKELRELSPMDNAAANGGKAFVY